MTIVTVNRLMESLTYNILTDEKDYLVGVQAYDWTEDKIVDHFRVGSNIEGEFCIEDSIGRFIPFLLEDIDSLIDTLMTYRQDNDKDIEIEKLQSKIRELENE